MKSPDESIQTMGERKGRGKAGEMISQMNFIGSDKIKLASHPPINQGGGERERERTLSHNHTLLLFYTPNKVTKSHCFTHHNSQTTPLTQIFKEAWKKNLYNHAHIRHT